MIVSLAGSLDSSFVVTFLVSDDDSRQLMESLSNTRREGSVALNSVIFIFFEVFFSARKHLKTMGFLWLVNLPPTNVPRNKALYKGLSTIG